MTDDLSPQSPSDETPTDDANDELPAPDDEPVADTAPDPDTEADDARAAAEDDDNREPDETP